jgi:hypothetical protein
MVNPETLQRIRELAPTDPTRALEMTLDEMGRYARKMRERGYDFKTCLYYAGLVFQEVRAWTAPLPPAEGEEPA